MFEILDGEPTVRESENPVRIKDMNGNIELKMFILNMRREDRLSKMFH